MLFESRVNVDSTSDFHVMHTGVKISLTEDIDVQSIVSVITGDDVRAPGMFCCVVGLSLRVGRS